MASIKWDLPIDEIGIYDKEIDSALILSKENGMSFICVDEEFIIPLSSINHVVMEEPKLFKKGLIAVFMNEEETFKFSYNGIDVPVFLEFNKKYKDEFYFIYSILDKNGVEIRL